MKDMRIIFILARTIFFWLASFWEIQVAAWILLLTSQRRWLRKGLRARTWTKSTIMRALYPSSRVQPQLAEKSSTGRIQIQSSASKQHIVWFVGKWRLDLVFEDCLHSINAHTSAGEYLRHHLLKLKLILKSHPCSLGVNAVLQKHLQPFRNTQRIIESFIWYSNNAE